MSDTVIQVDRLSKQYRLGKIGGKRLADDLNRWWAGLRGKDDPLSKVGTVSKPAKFNGNGTSAKAASFSDRIWALNDVSFEVKRGEVLGIIGRNGAGKSTLLKILSRVTAPTGGEVRVKGRIASLLEVGTGFHPELSGRENIFLNGAVLGMSKTEVRKKFDEIVDFSGVEQFIDTPVKRYSSGMYVRLAFAVAAHLEPEILVVDEVLAVGDAEFQKKCLGKMGQVAKGGRTVLFVSHNMAAVQHLCSRGMLLDDGCIKNIGGITQCIDEYLANVTAVTDTPLHERDDRTGNGTARILSFRTDPRVLMSGKACSFKLEIESDVEATVEVGIGISTQVNQPLLLLFSRHISKRLYIHPGKQSIECSIASLPLASGSYSVNLCLQRGDEIIDWIKEAARLGVQETDFFGTGKTAYMGQVPFLISHNWRSV